MTRVLHLITTLQAGGAQAMLTNLVTGGNSGRSIAHVVVEMTASGGCGERIRVSGIPLHSLGMTRGRISTSAVWRFVQLLRRERPSIVQTWLYHADLLGVLALPVLQVPLVWNVRCAWHVGIAGLAPRTCARLSRPPAAVVVNSRAGQAVHRELGYRPRRWCLIRNGFDVDVFKPDELACMRVRAELGLPVNAILVGLVGRWDPNKDHATFLAAAARLAGQRSDAHFVLAGEGLTPGNPALGELADLPGPMLVNAALAAAWLGVLLLVLFLRKLGQELDVFHSKSPPLGAQRFGSLLLVGALATVIVFNDYQMGNYAGLILLAFIYRTLQLRNQRAATVEAAP